jgi:hypothetical protein
MLWYLTTQRVSGFERGRERAVRIGRKTIQVPHLATGPGFDFSIEMESNAGTLERFLPSGLPIAP